MIPRVQYTWSPSPDSRQLSVAADARYSRASSTSVSNSAASSPASGCHCTPTAKRRDGSSTPSSVPSPAHARLDEPLPQPPDALVVVRRDVGRAARPSTPAACRPSPRRDARRTLPEPACARRSRPPRGGAGRGPRRARRSGAGSRGRSRAWACRARAPPRAAPARPRRAAPGACRSRDGRSAP